MFSADIARSQALLTIDLQQQSIDALKEFINDEFLKAVEIIHKAKGRVVISGIGKSAIIAQKIVATLNSTGTPALFMHAADAIHGDLGMIQPDDVVMIISKSGESPEIKVLIPFIKGFGNPVIALCGNANGYLATHADVFINSTVQKEACPNNLAPTTSTTAQMVMGDALAVCLLSLKGFTPRDFAKYHPGGSLGKRLYLRVGDIINRQEPPLVTLASGLREVIVEISGKRLGATAVADEAERVCGIITDGDIRRAFEQHNDISTLTAADILTKSPKSVTEEDLAATALELMREHDITQLLVFGQSKYTGILHLHDLLREGII